MKTKVWVRATTASLAAILLGIGLAIWAPTLTHPAHADVNDFTIESFDAEYTLSRDEAGRSTLHTVEHIVAVFPTFDQNRGLIRDITRVYDGHETNVQVLGVTDERGTPRKFITERYGDFQAVTIAVPEGQFVHGAQHYVIEYEQIDVTRFFDDTGVDEFYWDINGTGWTQPFDRVSARIVLEDNLASALTGDSACYYGAFGSDATCELAYDGTAFTTTMHNLTAGENVTVAIGFEPGTFTPAPTPPKPPTPFLQQFPLLIWGGVASLVAAVATLITTLIRARAAKTGRAIIAQYEPPANVSVALAAELLRVRQKSMTATLLDFAVRRKLRLLHHDETDQYGIQSLDNAGLLPSEGHTYARIFGSTIASTVAPGTTYWFSRTSTRLGDAAVDLKQRAAAESHALGLMKKTSGRTTAVIVLLLLAALGLPVLHAVILDNFVLMTILLAVGINALVWIILGVVMWLHALKRPTHEGALLLDHLKGLREYIRLAEADRIRMLQSASGAEVNEQLIVQVYERLLPYAALFGFEQEWQSELARYYRESLPDWVHGGANDTFMHALPIAAFSQSVSSAAVTRTVSSSGSGSGSSFSSFSGGSSGGGFSGGGGGGGGGRGI